MSQIRRIVRRAVMLATVIGCSSSLAQTIDPFYAGNYSFVDLGTVPGVPARLGGLTLKYDNPNLLVIGGAANSSVGQIYVIGVTRDAAQHITGFTGTASVFSEGAYNDGGVVFGPGHVLFLARWPVNQMGQVLPGSMITNKLIDMGPLGVEGSLSALNFIPAGFPGAGRAKCVTYSGGQWSDLTFAPDGMGTFDITNVTPIPTSRLGGAPEGFIYVPLGSPLFGAPSMLVAEYGAGNVAAYELTANGDPVVATRRTFVSGLFGAEGAFVDPLTGDFLFSTFGGGDRIIVVHGFTLTTCVRGDMNRDGLVDGQDIPGFVATLFDPAHASAADVCAADINVDRFVNDTDVPLMVTCLLAGGCP